MDFTTAAKAMQTTSYVWNKPKEFYNDNTLEELLKWAKDVVNTKFILSGWFDKAGFIRDLESKQFGSRRAYVQYMKDNDCEYIPESKIMSTTSTNIQDMMNSCVSSGFHKYLKEK